MTKILVLLSALTLPTAALAAKAEKPAAAKETPAAATKEAPAPAADKKVTLKGEVVDTVCYLTKGANGADHKQCAKGCLEKGAASFLADNGKLYLLIAEHGQEKLLDDAKSRAGDTITITGTEMSKGGLQALAVAEIK